MSVTVKSQREIELMREAGKILGTVLNELEKECKPGVTTYHINKIGEEMIKSYGCIPSFKGYQGYPAATNASCPISIPGIITVPVATIAKG